MSTSSPAVPLRGQALRNWRLIAGATGAVGGAAIVAGAFLPWVETFAGLIDIPGVRGSYGRVLAVAGAVIALAGVWHAVRGGRWSRWVTGVGGFAALGFAGYLLIQLAATTRNLGGDSMVLASGGPGLWVIGGGALAAFGTLFLPASTTAWREQTRPAVLARAERTRLAHWAGDLQSRGLRRGIQIGLGTVWLLDAALQFQPYMFGKAFVTQVLMPAAAGSPAAVASPALWADRLILHDVAAWNAVFAVIQLAIAAGLLWRPTVKAALAGSVLWAVAVWWLGEGLGGLLTGTASPVTGAPGAVILYGLIALLVWPRQAGVAHRDVATGGLLGGRWNRVVWVVLWGGFGYLMLQPAVRAPGTLHDAITGNAAGEPWWLASLDRGVATAVGSHGLAVSVGLAAAFALIAAGVLWPATARAAVLLAVVAGLAIWVIGENFGMILMGNMTDPNSGPLLVLLAAAFWPLAVSRTTVSPEQARSPQAGSPPAGSPQAGSREVRPEAAADA